MIGRIRGITLLLALLISPGAATAQVAARGMIQGRVVAGDTGEPLVGATVVVRSAVDSVIVNGELTNMAGTFRVVELPAGSYVVEAMFIGYSPVITPIVTLVSATDTAAVGTLRLGVEAIALDEVTVEAERPPVTFESDRTIYDARAMLAAEGGVATDLLMSVPELEVGIDGSISMRGTSPRIFINGRPAPLEGEALALFLEQFPSDYIQSIEVIPNPSARYDVEGDGGIVNIVLKEGVEIGLTGSIFANGSTRGGMGGGGRVTFQRGDLTLSGGSFVRHSNREQSSWDLRQNLIAEPTMFLRQDSWSDGGGLSGRLGVDAEYALGEVGELWVEVSAYNSDSDSDGSTTTTHMDAAREPLERYERLSASESGGLSGEVAVGFDYEFGPSSHELAVELEVETGSDDEYERIETRIDRELGATDVPAELTIEDAVEDERAMSFRVDYVHPWGEDGRFEIGYRGELEETNDERLLRLFSDAADAASAIDTESGFAHRELFNSVYLTLDRDLGERLGVQFGVRAELADTRLELPTGETFDNDYFSFFPNANISYALLDGRRIQLSYSRRIRRPSPRILNPIDDSTDPLNRRVGNPDIEPQYTHSLSIETSWTGGLGTLRFSPYYRQTTNEWERISRVNPDGVAIETWENLASSESYGASLTASFRGKERLRGYISVSGRREVRNANNVARNYTGASLDLSTRANITARVTDLFSFRTSISFSPPRDVPQGRIGARYRTDFALRQRFMDGRASVNLRLSDPFDLSGSSFTNRDPTFIQLGGSERSRRSASLSVSYTFGGGGDRDGRRGRRR